MCKSFALLYGNLQLSVKAISVETALVVGVSMLSFDFLQAGVDNSLAYRKIQWTDFRIVSSRPEPGWAGVAVFSSLERHSLYSNFFSFPSKK